jgi:hypothetical protein
MHSQRAVRSFVRGLEIRLKSGSILVKYRFFSVFLQKLHQVFRFSKNICFFRFTEKPPHPTNNYKLFGMGHSRKHPYLPHRGNWKLPYPLWVSYSSRECLVAQWVNFVTQLFFSGVIPHIHKSLIGKKGTAKPQ